MTTRAWRFGAIAIGCAALAACGNADKPTGPDAAPVASVNGQTITMADLKAEEGPNASKTTSPAGAQALHQAALENIIARELMARAAEEEKLDKTDAFKRQAKWAVDGVKAAALAKEVMGKAPQPTAAEISKFIADNPRAFADRKFLIVDQLQVMGPLPAIPQPLPTTLEAYAAILDKAGTPYQRRVEAVDSGAIDPAILQKMQALAPGAVFQANTGAGITVNQIRETRPTPLSGSAAQAIARNYLTNQAVIAASRDFLDGLKKDPKTKVSYEPAFQPAAK